MKILSHRGYWRTREEQNRQIAFERSFSLGFGTETDIRDHAGELVISHDMSDPDSISLECFLQIAARAKSQERLTIALNIKADGLADELNRAIVKHPQLDCFVFDMAVPDMVAYLNAGIPIFTRMSEVEREPVWLDRSAGVWLDGLESEWYGAEHIERLLHLNKRVCIVSPELHRRPYESLWVRLKSCDHSQLMLCTDYPEEAATFFERESQS